MIREPRQFQLCFRSPELLDLFGWSSSGLLKHSWKCLGSRIIFRLFLLIPQLVICSHFLIFRSDGGRHFLPTSSCLLADLSNGHIWTFSLSSLQKNMYAFLAFLGAFGSFFFFNFAAFFSSMSFLFSAFFSSFNLILSAFFSSLIFCFSSFFSALLSSSLTFFASLYFSIALVYLCSSLSANLTNLFF